MRKPLVQLILIFKSCIFTNCIFASCVLASGLLADSNLQAFDKNHEKFTQVLKLYQNEKGLLNYKKLKIDLKSNGQHPFLKYINEIQSVPYATYNNWTSQEKMAFLINSYNALTIKLIIDHYPVSSIKKIGGFFTKPWDVKFFSLFDGKIRSLDPIEHDWLRPVYKDYRIHSAVNCASLSCPSLRHEAYLGEKITEQLDEQMRLWVNDSNLNYYDRNNKTLKLSKIFDWYSKDFDKWGGGTLKVINRYLTKTSPDEKLSQVTIKYLDYDWGLNEVKNK